LPTTDIAGDAVQTGDWVILTADDVGTGTTSAPQYPGGIYTYNGAAYELVQENNDIGDILNSIIATAGEVDAGTAVDKVASVNQLALKYAKLNGVSTELFLVSAGNTDTNEAVNANQFPSTPITSTEANADWATA